MPSIDYDGLKRRVPLLAYLQRRGWFYTRSPTGVCRGACPIAPNFRLKPRFFVVSNEVWYCWKCKRGGSVLDLHALIHKLDIKQAAIALCEFMRIDIPYRERSKSRRPRKPRNREEGLSGGCGGEAPPVPTAREDRTEQERE